MEYVHGGLARLKRLFRCGGNGPRVFTRAEGYSEKDLLHFAYDHLASAQVLFERSPECYDSAAGLGHLGIELLLKALLLQRADEFPATHDLAKLRRLLARAAPEVEFTSEGRSVLSRINKFSSLRYPAPGGAEPIGTEDLSPLLNLAQAVVGAFPPKLQAEFAPRLEKGGRVLMRRPIDPDGAAQ
jgi:HEPN domain-containing protein